jgi:signal transduction histidine kinase/DNA-binding response OmpR family regulator
MSSENSTIAEHDRETALAFALAVAAGWIALGVLAAIEGSLPAVVVQLSAGTLSLSIWTLARARRPSVEAIVHAFCGVSAVALVVLSLLSGQASSQAWWVLPVIPLLAATLLGLRGALAWTLPIVGAVALVHVLDFVLPIAPAYESSDTTRTIGAVMLAALALAYTSYTRGAARRYLRMAEERENTIAAQAQLLYKAHDEIVHARDEAVRASRGKTEFLATLSHELRAPLNGLLGLSSVLLESKLTPQQSELVRTVHQSAGSMRKILNDVLDLSRIESGRLELHEESSDVREVIGEVLDVFAPTAAGKGVELAAIVDENVPEFLRIDPVRFGQIVTNLVNNALKFTSEGEVVVELSPDSRGYVMSVRDTGVGIAQEELKRIFQPFEQSKSAETSREIGSGLGLWIAQRIVGVMGGKIGVESVVGKGSRFFVEFAARHGEAAGRESIETHIGVRVLAIEDNEASARALEAIAPVLDIEVEVARSLEEAAKRIETMEVPALVIVDSTLPGAKPLAAAEALRALPKLKRLPFVSAVAPSAERLRVGVQPPFVATTLKPYRASRMRALLNDVLSPQPAMPTPVMLSPWRPLDVLVVDDDSTNRMVAMLLLERAGLRPHSAESGEDALQLLVNRRFDVVLLDLHMDGIDGLETARRIRKELDPQRKLWIVALTASVYDEDRQRCLDAGMDDFIPKPIEIGLFRAALERAQRAVRRRTTPTSTNRLIIQDGGLQPKVLERLYEALGKDPHELALLVEDYARSSAELCGVLRHAIVENNLKEAQRAAHTLASSSGQLGAYRLEKLARTMERDAGGGKLPNETVIDEIYDERQSAVLRMHQWLGERLIPA